MDLAQLIDGLSRPEAYPHPAPDVRILQTHVSVVFLAGERAYKIKKPVNLGFLDFRSPEARHAACEAEVRLNSRLAPGVYLGVQPVTRRDGGLRFGGDGEVVEHAVVMRRLPDNERFVSLLERGQLTPLLLSQLAAHLVAFFERAEGGPRVTAFATWDAVAANCRENFAQSTAFIGDTVSAAVDARLRALTEAELAARRELIDARARRGVPRDGHGDLRLDHVYLERSELLVVDCIEFNERFRCQDPVADVAFLVMELEHAGRHDLARAFTEAYLAAAGDEEARALLPLYVAYRHVVRGKVRSMESREVEVASEERETAARRARGHFLGALVTLAAPAERPGLVLVGGLPGSGKTTLARGLVSRAGFERVSSDEVRKELAGLPAGERARAAFGEGLYTREWTDRTYAECRRRAEQLLFEGRRVVVDASFGAEAHRRSFLDAARELGTPGLLLVCEVPDDEARRRIGARRGDASDADAAVLAEAAARWEPLSPATAVATHVIDSGGAPEATLEEALAVLAKSCDAVRGPS